MINFPVTFHRDFRNDLLALNQPPESLSEKCQRVALATLPLLSMCRLLRGPLSLGMSCMRAVTHIKQTVGHYHQRNKLETAFHFLHANLATASMGLFFFNPVLCFLTSSFSDFIIHSCSLVEEAKAGHFLAAAESLAFMTLDFLFVASFCYGAIETTVACMLLQIAVGCYLFSRHFQKGNYLEGVCQAVLTGSHIHQAIPQIKLFQWTMAHGSSFEVELKRDKRGFVYLDMPDEALHSLFEQFKEDGMKEPPYFHKGMAGAHVSVILAEEMIERGGIPIDAIGKKFTFRIAHFDVVKPGGWNDTKKAYILSGLNPELDAIRIHHGFSPRIHGQDFHFTFGLSS
jgi:hypothetical protein